NAVSQPRASLQTSRGEERAALEPALVSLEDEDLAFIRVLPVEVRRADDDVVVAIAVHVERGRHREAEPGVGLVALPDRHGRGGEPGCRAEVDVDASLALLAVGGMGSADDDVGKTIPVHVARGADRDAEAGARLIALGGPGRRGGEAAR